MTTTASSFPGPTTPADSNIEIYVINADGSGERRLTRNPGNDFGSAWSPDGRKIAFGRGAGGHSEQIYVMNADGSGQRRLTRLAAYNSVLAWLPDGKIAFVSFHGPNDFEIYVMNADGSGLRNLTREWGLDVAAKVLVEALRRAAWTTGRASTRPSPR